MNISEKIFSLRKKLHDHNYRYYVLDEPTISDYDFDMMLKELNDLEKSNPEFFDKNSPTQRVGAPPSETFEQVVHANQMLSLSNVFNFQKKHMKYRGRTLKPPDACAYGILFGATY